MATPIKIGITQGDLNGICYEVILKTLIDTRILDICTPILYGSSKIAAYHRKNIGAEHFTFNIVRSAGECLPRRANLVNVMDDTAIVEMGKPTEISGKGALSALYAAAKDLRDGIVDAIVTAPFNKQNMAMAGFKYTGHTEFFASVFKSDALMLMAHQQLRVAVATTHVPLCEVPSKLTQELILHKLTLFNQSLIKDFGIHRPRIAILGLNPHAGDQGLLGREEGDIIVPAMGAAAQQGLLVFGPFAADGFFANHYGDYDGALAMYHDQGLAPFKALSRGEGVNFTAGLPVVRTSPAHGTAFDIAGKNMANPESFRNALYLACDIVRSRQRYAEMAANPLGYASKNADIQ
jgi:4-hydroxythreonine-4-phosphate dehydrogenase